MRYSRLLEENNFAGKKADYLCLLIFNASILLVSQVRCRFRRRIANPYSWRLGDISTFNITVLVGFISLLFGIHLVEEESDAAAEHLGIGQVSYSGMNGSLCVPERFLMSDRLHIVSLLRTSPTS
jgi:hypothetical protein